MADETPPPPGAAGQPDRRRPAPTIDLKATEIASEPIPDEAAGESAAASATGPATGAPGQTPPPGQSRSDPDAAAEAPRGSPSGRPAAVSLVGAGMVGAILALGVAWGVEWGIGTGNDASDTAARIAQLERQVADLAGQVRADAASSAATGDLADRLQKVEAQQARTAQQPAAPPQPAPDPALGNRIAAMETQLKSFAETVGALGQRRDRSAAANAAALSELKQKLAGLDASGAQSSEAADAAANADATRIAALADRIDTLEGNAKTLGTQEQTLQSTLAADEAKRAAETSDDRAVRTAVVAAALAAAVERGGPFAAELTAAQSQGADAKALVPLAGFAATGVPRAQALARELSALEPALLQAAAGTPSDGGFLEKLQTNAERLVRIRPVEEVAGEEPAAVIARAEIKAARGDVAGALMEVANLPAPIRAPAQAWIGSAQARAAAIAASRAFAADALAALARPSH
jgi:hypothetical protein